jgi:phosphohistidine phosphatase
MKILYLMRHAKSSWKDPDLSDHRRPLNKRGKKNAPEMGRRLKKQGAIPDVIVSSDARRALDTAAAVAAILDLPADAIHQDDALYHASPDRILDIIQHFTDKWKRVMVVGHNPGFTELANRFVVHPIANMPTAGIVELRFDVRAWRHIGPHNLTFSCFDYPKNKPT